MAFPDGDKVIQTENDYDKEVFNGDIGIVERIDLVEHDVTIHFDERPENRAIEDSTYKKHKHKK